ncbi:MAG: GNAT family protein [Saprospiraceae bacterium]|nr:GNAT family N-acetyltransferase [Lewinella sp.]
MRKELIDLDTAILTARTVVRRFRENEGVQLYDLFHANRALLIDNFPKTDRAMATREQAEQYIRQTICDWLFHKDFTFGIWDNESARLVGFIRIFNLDWDVPKAEISYFIDKDFGGKGLMTEALTAVLELAFRRMKIAKLYIRTATDNYGSQRVARKLGFRREGDFRGDFRTPSGDLIDTMLFGLTAVDSGLV